MFLQYSTFSGFLAICCATSVASESDGTFVAFNDLVPSRDGLPAGGACSLNRFTHGRHWERGGGVLAAEAQTLLDSQGSSSPASVRFEEVVTHENTINNNIVPVVLRRDSPAWEEFGECLCQDAACDEASGECTCAALDGSLSYNDAPGWEFKYVFEGLDPRCEASVAFFVERGGARHDASDDYNERYSVFTLGDVASFTSDTGSALRSLQEGSSLAIRAGNNSAGHVAKWSNIRHSGSFVVSVSHDRTGELADLSPPPHAYKAYAGGVFKLSQACEPAIDTEEVLELPGGLVVSVALSLEVDEPAAFVADESSAALVARGVAAATGVDVGDVTAVLSVAWRRLSTTRRLAGVVTADMSIAVADSAAAELMTVDVAAVEPEALESSVNEAFASAGKAEAVNVVEVGVPVIAPPAPPVEGAEADAADRARLPAEDNNCFVLLLVAVVGGVTAVSILAAAGFVLARRWRKRGSSPDKADPVVPTEAPLDDKENNDDVTSESSTVTPTDNLSNTTPPMEV